MEVVSIENGEVMRENLGRALDFANAGSLSKRPARTDLMPGSRLEQMQAEGGQFGRACWDALWLRALV